LLVREPVRSWRSLECVYVADRLGLVALDLRSESQYTSLLQLAMNIAVKRVRH
jgi:hypothetical protein